MSSTEAYDATGSGVDEDSEVIKKVNYVLGSCYLVLGALSVFQVVVKYKAERKLKTSVVFPAEIFCLCLVRATYFFTFLTTWAKNTPKFEGHMVFFVDTLPELLFVAIYVLLVSSWGVTWGKARKARPFSPKQFWITYSGVIAGFFILSLVLSLVCSAGLNLPYNNVIVYEGIFLLSLSCVCVLAALLFGVKLYLMLHNSATKSKYLSHVMRQLLFLVILVTVSFAIKGICVYSFSTSARHKWVYRTWDTTKFGAFWFAYFTVSELIPFVLIWIVLQRKDDSSNTQSSNSYTTISASSASSISSISRTSSRASLKRDSSIYDAPVYYDASNQSLLNNKNNNTTKAKDVELFGRSTTIGETGEIEEDEYDYHDASALDH